MFNLIELKPDCGSAAPVPRLDELRRIYERAFSAEGLPPDLITERISRTCNRTGFKVVAAVDASDAIAGFAYGYIGDRGQWWHDFVREHLDADTANEWLNGSFEVVEVAVDPKYQGQGLGKQLITKLLCDVAANTAVLSVRVDNKTARQLYEKLGWKPIHEGIVFPGYSNAFAIMAVRLPLA